MELGINGFEVVAHGRVSYADGIADFFRAHSLREAFGELASDGEMP